ncbi:putative von Willebrand factor type A domain containing protein [Blattamonas nauphoetae]|uniref:von Willebrand factor type A domain containing protein n=1 Tax=Blattamonas nauphoetae TaxID=2049346 RepID=A0ABQ9X2E4_9EUKA|nr:putative von Willebrand factor type A domain containing protein [Blattamonas nauphoetae]
MISHSIDDFSASSPISQSNNNDISKSIRSDDISLDCSMFNSPTPGQSFVCATITTPNTIPQISNRLPLDIVALFDTSQSMANESLYLPNQSTLTRVKTCLRTLVEQLSENDRFGMVAFGTTQHILLGLTEMTNGAKQYTSKILDHQTNQAHGGTDILKGMKVALDELFRKDSDHAHPDKDSVKNGRMKVILVFTDGLDAFVRPKTTFNRQRSVKFTPTIHTLNTKIESLFQSYPSDLLSVHSFGIGPKHDDLVLSSLASKGNGSYYFIEKDEHYSEAVGDCLFRLFNTSASQIQCQISFDNASPITSLVSLHNPLSDGTVRVPCMISSTTQRVIWKIESREPDVLSESIEPSVQPQTKKEQPTPPSPPDFTESSSTPSSTQLKTRQHQNEQSLKKTPLCECQMKQSDNDPNEASQPLNLSPSTFGFSSLFKSGTVAMDRESGNSQTEEDHVESNEDEGDDTHEDDFEALDHTPTADELFPSTMSLRSITLSDTFTFSPDDNEKSDVDVVDNKKTDKSSTKSTKQKTKKADSPLSKLRMESKGTITVRFFSTALGSYQTLKCSFNYSILPQTFQPISPAISSELNEILSLQRALQTIPAALSVSTPTSTIIQRAGKLMKVSQLATKCGPRKIPSENSREWNEKVGLFESILIEVCGGERKERRGDEDRRGLFSRRDGSGDAEEEGSEEKNALMRKRAAQKGVSISDEASIVKMVDDLISVRIERITNGVATSLKIEDRREEMMDAVRRMKADLKEAEEMMEEDLDGKRRESDELMERLRRMVKEATDDSQEMKKLRSNMEKVKDEIDMMKRISTDDIRNLQDMMGSQSLTQPGSVDGYHSRKEPKSAKDRTPTLKNVVGQYGTLVDVTTSLVTPTMTSKSAMNPTQPKCSAGTLFKILMTIVVSTFAVYSTVVCSMILFGGMFPTFSSSVTLKNVLTVSTHPHSAALELTPRSTTTAFVRVYPTVGRVTETDNHALPHQNSTRTKTKDGEHLAESVFSIDEDGISSPIGQFDHATIISLAVQKSVGLYGDGFYLGEMRLNGTTSTIESESQQIVFDGRNKKQKEMDSGKTEGRFIDEKERTYDVEKEEEEVFPIERLMELIGEQERANHRSVYMDGLDQTRSSPIPLSNKAITRTFAKTDSFSPPSPPNEDSTTGIVFRGGIDADGADIFNVRYLSVKTFAPTSLHVPENATINSLATTSIKSDSIVVEDVQVTEQVTVNGVVESTRLNVHDSLLIGGSGSGNIEMTKLGVHSSQGLELSAKDSVTLRGKEGVQQTVVEVGGSGMTVSGKVVVNTTAISETTEGGSRMLDVAADGLKTTSLSLRGSTITPIPNSGSTNCSLTLAADTTISTGVLNLGAGQSVSIEQDEEYPREMIVNADRVDLLDVVSTDEPILVVGYSEDSKARLASGGKDNMNVPFKSVFGGENSLFAKGRVITDGGKLQYSIVTCEGQHKFIHATLHMNEMSPFESTVMVRVTSATGMGSALFNLNTLPSDEEGVCVPASSSSEIVSIYCKNKNPVLVFDNTNLKVHPYSMWIEVFIPELDETLITLNISAEGSDSPAPL